MTIPGLRGHDPLPFYFAIFLLQSCGEYPLSGVPKVLFPRLTDSCKPAGPWHAGQYAGWKMLRAGPRGALYLCAALEVSPHSLTHDEVHRLELTLQEGSLPQRAECQVATLSEPQNGLFPPFHGGSGVVLLCTQPVFLAVPFFQLLLVPVTFLCCRSAAPPVMGPELKTLLRFCSLYGNFNLRCVSWVLECMCVCMCICKLAFFSPSLLFFSCFTA